MVEGEVLSGTHLYIYMVSYFDIAGEKRSLLYTIYAVSVRYCKQVTLKRERNLSYGQYNPDHTLTELPISVFLTFVLCENFWITVPIRITTIYSCNNMT